MTSIHWIALFENITKYMFQCNCRGWKWNLGQIVSAKVKITKNHVNYNKKVQKWSGNSLKLHKKLEYIS